MELFVKQRQLFVNLLTNKHTIFKFHDIYIKRYIMKLRSLVNENTNKKIHLLITETQFKYLAKNVLQLQEQKQLSNSNLIKTNSNAKKK
jgi:hypothetical protein